MKHENIASAIRDKRWREEQENPVFPIPPRMVIPKPTAATAKQPAKDQEETAPPCPGDLPQLDD